MAASSIHSRSTNIDWRQGQLNEGGLQEKTVVNSAEDIKALQRACVEKSQRLGKIANYILTALALSMIALAILGAAKIIDLEKVSIGCIALLTCGIMPTIIYFENPSKEYFEASIALNNEEMITSANKASTQLTIDNVLKMVDAWFAVLKRGSKYTY